MPQSVLLKAGGLYTFPNNLSEIPQGALTVADNVVIDKNGIIESRRGFHQYGNTFGIGTDRAKQLMVYKNRLLRHFDTTMQYDDGTGNFISFDGTFVEEAAGIRMKSVEANGNFYFTTAAGIYRISAATASQFSPAPGYVRLAGGVQALDINGVVDYSSGGWFIYQTSTPGQSKVAYRMTWAFKDANGNLVEGAPSSRLVLTNYSTTDSANVLLTFQIPSDIGTTDTQFFYRIYRTAVVQTSVGVTLDNLDPGDEEYLVIEDFPSSAQLTARSVTVLDNTPEAFRKNGSLLYTNPVSGDGILQSNYPPPIAQDINSFQSTVFYANTKTIQQFNLAMLSTLSLTSGVSTITITDGVTSNTYTFVGRAQQTTFTFSTQTNTNNGGYFLINSASDARKYFVWFDKTGSTNAPTGADTLGRLGVKVDISAVPGASPIAPTVTNALNGIVDFIAFNANYVFTVTAANATVGAVYSDSNSNEFVVTTTITGGTTLTTKGFAAPPTSGVLTKTSGTGDAFITFASFTTTVSNDIRVVNTDNGPVSNLTPANGLVPVGAGFAFVVNQTGTGEDTATQKVLLGANPSPSISIDESARSLVKVINANPASIVNAYYTSGPSDLPGLILLQAKDLSQTQFWITANSTATGNEFSPTLPTSGATVISANEVELNAIYYSKFQQPEAVPIVNKFLVGPKDKAIVRILPLRTGLMILKEDGIYRLTGTNGQFNIDPFDNSAIILASDSAQVLNNQIYMFSTQGVVTLTDTGVNVISRPIEDLLTKIITPSFDYKPNTFGVAYESDRAYLLWTVTNNNDTEPTQCFRFNTFTTAWTRWPITKTCGLVKFDEQLLYLGAGDQNFIEQERKNLDRTDYADREFSLQIPSSAVISDDEIILSSTTDVTDGDVLFQTQYLTLGQFNQLLKMLDTDIGVGYHNYFATLGQISGANLRDALDNLANKLDTDPGLSETNFFSSMTHGTNFVDFQIDFNILVGLINANANPIFKNYPTSVGTIIFDMNILSTVQNTNDVIVSYVAPIIEGPITLSAGIDVEIVWAPQTFGDPSISKHVSEGTFIFNDTVFSTATISYASDLMPSFEEVSFDESGLGDWGSFAWGTQFWGGTGSSVPLRTYIPRNKQYCRFLRPRFVHNTSREKFELLGASLTFRPLTERAYRS